LYAATALLDAHAAHARVLDLVDRRLGRHTWAPPVAAYRERDLLKALVATAPDEAQRHRAQGLLAGLESQLAELDQAVELQRDFPTLVFPDSGGQGPVWRLFGKVSWLVSEGPALAGLPPFVIAVRSAPIFAALQRDPILSAAASGTLQFVTSGSTGLAFGERFPGLRVVFPAADETAVMRRWARKRTFYILALISVLGVTVLGGYVLGRDMHRELEVADMRSQFVASVSHELRTPLTSIRMFAETLQMGRPIDPSARAEYLNTIVYESDRLTRLINNVLDFSKIERGQTVYRLEPAPLDVVVRQAAGTMQYPLERHGFQLHVTTQEEIPPVRIDIDAIQQALLNLLNNAMKYSRDDRRIDLTLARVNGQNINLMMTVIKTIVHP
jgi:signal transduction histidine kinase